MNDCDVLVVGAGPVGLAAANTLLFHGVKPRLIERLPEVINQSRAAGIQTRTLEVLQRLGLVGKFLARGTAVHGVRVFDGERKVVAHVQLDTNTDTPFAFMLGLGQSCTENLLIDGLAEHGAAVERGTELISFTQDADGVTAQLKHSNGDEETVRCKYLVGCDGSKSSVRHQLGLTLEGETIQSHWFTADCSVDWEFDRDEAVAFLTTKGFLFAMAIEDGRWRFITPALNPLPDGQQATLEDVQAVCDTFLPVPCKLHTPHWVTQFGLNTRLVPTMKQGRVFLCGDAAHVHSPLGGQGMNTGIQDAFNLSWKLALCLRDKAGDALLESFNVERHANAKRMLSGVGPGTKVINLRNPVAAEIRNRIMRFALQFDAVREKVRRGVEEVDVNYRRGPIADEWIESLPDSEREAPAGFAGHVPDFGEGPRAGDRAPDIEALEFPDGCHQSLFESWARNPKSQTLIFAGNATAARLDILKDAAARLSAVYGDWMDILIIQAEAPAAGVVLDPDGCGHHRYAARHECLYWVRPDGYIGFRSQPASVEALANFIRQISA